MEIRPEKPADHDAVRDVLEEAFKRADEAELVDRLRAEHLIDLALVAVAEDGDVVGHIAFSAVTFPNPAVMGVGLAPLSVHPDFQGMGVGKKLVWAGLQRLKKRGLQAVVVLGDPGYYKHFGFVSAAARGLTCNHPAPAGAFQVLELSDGVLAGVQGEVNYAF